MYVSSVCVHAWLRFMKAEQDLKKVDFSTAYIWTRCVPGWHLVRRACTTCVHARKILDIGGCLLFEAYRKMARQNRMMTSLMTLRDPMTSWRGTQASHASTNIHAWYRECDVSVSTIITSRPTCRRSTCARTKIQRWGTWYLYLYLSIFFEYLYLYL